MQAVDRCFEESHFAMFRRGMKESIDVYERSLDGEIDGSLGQKSIEISVGQVTDRGCILCTTTMKRASGVDFWAHPGPLACMVSAWPCTSGHRAVVGGAARDTLVPEPSDPESPCGLAPCDAFLDLCRGHQPVLCDPSPFPRRRCRLASSTIFLHLHVDFTAVRA